MQGNTAAGRELDPWSWAVALIATDIPDLKAKYGQLAMSEIAIPNSLTDLPSCS
jgi:hypothetical protein